MIVYLKTKEEIEGFKKAGKFAGQVLQKLIYEVAVGKTTNELDKLAREECERLGAKPAFLGYSGYPAAICASNNSTLVHGFPNDIPLKSGDVLSIDVGVDVDGFIGDTAETIIVGNPSDQEPKAIELVTSCQIALHQAIALSKQGMKLSDVSKEIFNEAKRNGYSVPFEYGGHGIDRHVLHAAPFVPNVPDEAHDIKLRAGMIIAIEPMFILGKDPSTKVAEDGWGVNVNGLAAHCEHTVLVDFGTGIALTERRKNG